MSTWDEARWLADNEPIPGFPSLDELCSPEYRAQLATMPWGKGGGRYVPEVVALTGKGPRLHITHTILDYGCGTVDLAGAVKRLFPGRTDLIVHGYDPAIPGKAALPQPAHVVLCTDVLEHVEPDRLEAVLSHLFYLTKRVALVVIAMRPADKRLPDGRNAHLIIDNDVWWCNRLAKAGNWKIDVRSNDGSGGMLKVLLKQRVLRS